MPTSRLDEYLHQFRCEAPECRKTFKKVLRSLLHADEVVCPHCGTTIDIRESKSSGDIGRDFDMANDFDNKAMKE